jgi:hypothetical protein
LDDRFVFAPIKHRRMRRKPLRGIVRSDIIRSDSHGVETFQVTYESDERIAIQQEGCGLPIKIVPVYPVDEEEEKTTEKNGERNNQRRPGSTTDRR